MLLCWACARRRQVEGKGEWSAEGEGECGGRSAECRVPSAECRVPSAECRGEGEWSARGEGEPPCDRRVGANGATTEVWYALDVAVGRRPPAKRVSSAVLIRTADELIVIPS